jgi:hypothetical protein
MYKPGKTRKQKRKEICENKSPGRSLDSSFCPLITEKGGRKQEG